MRNILVIDDEVELDFIFRAMLENELSRGLLTLSFFHDPIKFLEYFQQNFTQNFSCILCDINMPGLSGVELVRSLRNLGYRGDICFMSAYTEEAYANEINELGIARFIAKPLDFEQLKRVILPGA